MRETLHLKTTVLPGGKIEIRNGELREGESVEIVVLRSETTGRKSILDVLAEAPGKTLFQTAAEADSYMRSERDSWGSQGALA